MLRDNDYKNGAFPSEPGYRFSFTTRGAHALSLLLFKNLDDDEPSREIIFDPVHDRMGEYWCKQIADVAPGIGYAYRINDETIWTLDPWARQIYRGAGWETGTIPTDSFVAKPPKGVLTRPDSFDWKGTCPPRIPLENSVVYELHTRGFTYSHTADVAAPGTFRGLIEKLPYLKELGITAIELLPVQEFNELEYHFATHDDRAGLRNYWGYSTQGFFAPKAGFAVHDPRREFKELVRATHALGMEIWLDVVYNHTGETSGGDPTQIFKGVDKEIWYLTHNGGHTNYSGCGNTVNCNHPWVRSFIIESLRHWVTEYHVDGFRFDLASVLCRSQTGEILEHPPLIDEIDEDPILRETKLIAEAWDAAGAYQIGNFPGKDWSEWNGQFRDDIRSFWTQHPPNLSIFATRMMGSEDIYSLSPVGPLTSINFVTCHDGFTLNDMVSYAEKHNLANGEGNRDGDNHNHSVNFGVEGPTDDPEILAKRLQQQKNLLACLLLAQGVPMILAGDEFGRTQQGSNNAYCQDNEMSWVDWSLLDANQEVFQFTSDLLKLRKEYRPLRRKNFVGPLDRIMSKDLVTWFGPAGEHIDWTQGRSLGWRFYDELEEGQNMVIIVNADEKPVIFDLPEGTTELRLSTSPHASAPEGDKEWTAPAQSVTVLI